MLGLDVLRIALSTSVWVPLDYFTWGFFKSNVLGFAFRLAEGNQAMNVSSSDDTYLSSSAVIRRMVKCIYP